MLSNSRRIRKAIKSMPTIEGADVHIKRAFGFNRVPELDPFLLLDEFYSAYEHAGRTKNSFRRISEKYTY